jgi:phospholipid N-methyltransferase
MKNALRWFHAVRGNPRQMGAVLPSTRTLARAMAREALQAPRSEWIVEIGSGSGHITEALHRLCGGRTMIRTVEVNESLAAALRRQYADIEVFTGRFEELATQLFQGIDHAVVVSSVPLFSLPADHRIAFLSTLTRFIRSGRVSRYVQYTHWPVLPWGEARAICGSHPRMIPLNLPPAWIWRRDYFPVGATQSAA